MKQPALFASQEAGAKFALVFKFAQTRKDSYVAFIRGETFLELQENILVFAFLHMVGRKGVGGGNVPRRRLRGV